ncbi:hypothetical protein ABT288_40675 [Streptomyces sp. NPDC001093]|uniref:hypothetical protein n=1 Tax=Streptomyces sp. NPDC001093 TaxID=3154376 RepID=UPI00332F605B
MRLKQHFMSRAAVIRASYDTTLASLENSHQGQILAPVDASIIETVAGKPRRELPGTQLWVMARLASQSAEELHLQQWQPCSGQRPTWAA